MRLSPTIILLLISSAIHSQSINNNKDIFFNEGIIAFENADYIAADSLFQKAFELIPERKACYNLGLTKFMLDDLCAGCSYMMLGKEKYSDINATQLFNELCIRKIDSLYLDKDYNPLSSSKKHKYLIEEIYYHCDSSIRGIIHKKGHRSTLVKINDLMNPKTVNIYAKYSIDDSIKYYTHISNSTYSLDNKILLDDFEIRLEEYLKSNYDLSVVPHGQAYCIIHYSIDTGGKVVDTNISTFPHDYIDEMTASKIFEDIKKAVFGIRGLKPDKYRKEYVASKHSILLALY